MLSARSLMELCPSLDDTLRPPAQAARDGRETRDFALDSERETQRHTQQGSRISLLTTGIVSLDYNTCLNLLIY